MTTSLAYTGSRTTKHRNARGKGITLFALDQDNRWQERQSLKILDNPSFLTFDRERQFIYTVHGDLREISAYKIDRTDGTLTHINTVTLPEGQNPVYIVPDKFNQRLVIATLQGGTVFVVEREQDGSLGKLVSQFRFAGKTDDSISHAHQCIWDHKENYLFVPQQGRQIGYAGITVLKYDHDNGSFTQADYFRSREYSEPRHIAIHPNNQFCYLVNEKDNTVTFFNFDDKSGKLTAKQIIPVMPETYTGEGQSSAILVDKTGQWVIESTRIYDALTVFKVDNDSGFITYSYSLRIPGKTPRFMTFDRQGEKLYVACEDSDEIIVYYFDHQHGILSQAETISDIGSPTSIIFSEL